MLRFAWLLYSRTREYRKKSLIHHSGGGGVGLSVEVIDRADHSEMEREKWWTAGSEASQTETNISPGSVWKTDEAEQESREAGRMEPDAVDCSDQMELVELLCFTSADSSRRIQLGGEPPPSKRHTLGKMKASK